MARGMRQGRMRKPDTVMPYTGDARSRQNRRVSGTASTPMSAAIKAMMIIPPSSSTRMASMRDRRSASPRLMLKSIRPTATMPKGTAQKTAIRELEVAKDARPALPTWVSSRELTIKQRNTSTNRDSAPG